MSIEKEEPEISGALSARLIAAILAGVVGLWLLTPAVMMFALSKWDERGQAGDLFGSINALFSGLAFAGVIIAILLQRQELALQRLELRETRREMKRTADAQEAAQQALNKTIWAQSYKVAIDILVEERTIQARDAMVDHKEQLTGDADGWGDYLTTRANLVARSFESVGQMVRKDLLPSDYIVDSWSIPIRTQWEILEQYIYSLRKKRSDPFFGQDFEYLAAVANAFLDQEDRLK